MDSGGGRTREEATLAPRLPTVGLACPCYTMSTHPWHPDAHGRFIHDWVYSGVFRDVYGEFMIQVNHEYLGFRGRWPQAAGLGLHTCGSGMGPARL